MSNIDWDFIAEREGNRLIGYVPNVDGSKSGVTIASGFDLGTRNENDIKDLPSSIQDKLKPFLGLKGQPAEELAKKLVVTSDEAKVINDFAKREATLNLSRKWREKTGQEFAELPKHKATVVASVAFQYGDLASKTPNFWRQTTTGDWDGALRNLRNFGDDYKTRRNMEGTYLEQGMKMEEATTTPIGQQPPMGFMETQREALEASRLVEGASGTIPEPEVKKKSKIEQEPELPILEQRVQPTPQLAEEEALPIIKEPQEKLISETDVPPNILEQRVLPGQVAEEDAPLGVIEEPSIVQTALREGAGDIDVLERQKVFDEAKNIPEVYQEVESVKKPAQQDLATEEQELFPRGQAQAPTFTRAARPITISELLAKEKASEEAKEKARKGLMSSLIRDEWTLSLAFADRKEFAPDTEFRFTEELAAELTEGLPEQYHAPIIEESFSLAQAKANRQEALRLYETDQKLDLLGWEGVGKQMIAAFTDPGAIAISIGTEGVAAPAIWGNKLSRLGRIMRGATGAAATNGLIESYLVSQSNFKDPYDILYAMSAGVVLGGAFGGLSRSDPLVKAANKMRRDAEIAQQYEAATHINNNILGDDSPDKLSVGAASNPFQPAVQDPDILTKTDEIIESLDDPVEPFLPRFRVDMTSFLLASKNRIANYLGQILGEDPVGSRKDGTQVVGKTADILKSNEMKSSFARYYQVYDSAYNEWAKGAGYGFFERVWNKPRVQFGELVADAIENPDLPVSEPIRRAARRQAEIKRDLLRKLKEAGVPGFEEIPEDLSYFTHLWDSYKLGKARPKFGVGTDPTTGKPIGIEGLLANSLMNATEDLQEEVANSIAKSMVNKISRSAAGMDAGSSRLFNADSRDVMKRILVEEDYMSEDEAERIMALFERTPDGRPARAKRRLKFDMDAQITNAQGETLRIKDLMNRNAEDVFTYYAAQMSGRIGMAKVGIKSELEFKKLLNANLDEAFGREGAKGRQRAEKENLVAETMFNMILNKRAPLAADPNGTYARAARLLKDYNFTRLMGQTGFPQLGELGNALSVNGLRGLAQALPEFGRMLRRAQNGELEDPLAREIEASYGTGSDRLSNQAMNKADTEAVYGEGRGDILDKSLAFMQPLKRGLADASGMSWITLGLERMTSRIVTQTLTDVAFKDAKLSIQRLASLGLDESMASRIRDQMIKHAILEPSTLFKNRKVRAINLAKWDDDEAYDAFGVALRRWTNRAIQQNDVGSLNVHMTSEMGSIITQFRSFQIVSWAKQFLHNLKMKDVRAMQSFSFALLTAGMAYAAQVQFRSIGRSDKEEYLKENLSYEAIGKAAFQRSSWASVLPGAYDTASMFFTDDPTFAYRSSGLQSNFITGNPSVQLISKGLSSAQAISRAVVNPDLQLSQGQARAAVSIAPYQNVLGIQQAFNLLIETRPETTKVE